MAIIRKKSILCALLSSLLFGIVCQASQPETRPQTLMSLSSYGYQTLKKELEQIDELLIQQNITRPISKQKSKRLKNKIEEIVDSALLVDEQLKQEENNPGRRNQIKDDAFQQNSAMAKRKLEPIINCLTLIKEHHVCSRSLYNVAQYEADRTASIYCTYHIPAATTLAQKYWRIMNISSQFQPQYNSPLDAQRVARGTHTKFFKTNPTATAFHSSFKQTAGGNSISETPETTAQIRFSKKYFPKDKSTGAVETISPYERGIIAHETAHAYTSKDFFAQELALHTLFLDEDLEAAKALTHRTLNLDKNDWNNLSYSYGTLNGLAKIKQMKDGAKFHKKIIDYLREKQCNEIVILIVENWMPTSEKKAQNWHTIYKATDNSSNAALDLDITIPVATLGFKQNIETTKVSLRNAAATLMDSLEDLEDLEEQILDEEDDDDDKDDYSDNSVIFEEDDEEESDE